MDQRESYIESELGARRLLPQEDEKVVAAEHYIRVDKPFQPLPEATSALDRSRIAPNHVFFTWDIHYACNYNCTYCNTPKRVQPADMWTFRERKRVVYPGLRRWLEVWSKIHDLYGSSEIHITGGEPFIYPDFLELITELSKIHTLEIITNLAVDAKEIAAHVTPDRVRIGTTFHPEFADLRGFLEKHKALRAGGFETWANYVLYPPLLAEVPNYKREFDALGIPFNLQPYLGWYNNKEYPMGYSDEELSFLKACYGSDDIVNKKTMEWKIGSPKRDMRGQPCRMGQMYAKIYPTGDAYRCCASGGAYIGNLIEGTFQLNSEPLPCDGEHCHCWRGMLVSQEEGWKRHWVIPHKQAVRA